MRAIITLCLALLLIASCKKEKLEGKYDFLIGKWKCFAIQGGGGSGTNKPRECGEQDNTIEFYKDGGFEITHHPEGKTYKGRIKEIIDYNNHKYGLELRFSNIGKNFLEKEVTLYYEKGSIGPIVYPDRVLIFSSTILNEPFYATIYYNKVE